MTTAELRELLELCERATPGPWAASNGPPYYLRRGPNQDSNGELAPPISFASLANTSKADAALICAMRNHFAALVRVALASKAAREMNTPEAIDELDAALAAVFGGDDAE